MRSEQLEYDLKKPTQFVKMIPGCCMILVSSDFPNDYVILLSEWVNCISEIIIMYCLSNVLDR